MKDSTQYLYQSHVAFAKIDDGIYKVVKIRSEFQYRHEAQFKKSDYVTANKVVDVLNNFDNTLILDDRLVYIHANFTLEEEGQ